MILSPYRLKVLSEQPNSRLARKLRGEKLKPIPKVSTPNCVYRGDVTGDVVPCKSCNGKVELKVFACSEHGSCLPGKRSVDGIRACETCQDRVEPNDLVMQAAADEFLGSSRDGTVPISAGRGIVISAGGNYLPSAYVTVRMLRHVGCTLPVEIWHLSGERDERYEAVLAPYGVVWRDIDSHPVRKSRRGVKGFQTKLFAVMASPFEEVLSLDPDCYPVADPTILFDLPEYRQLGGIYWPDGPHTDKWTNWKRAGVKPRGPCGLETGIYLVNKRLAWDVLKLAEWYDDHPEWTYGKPEGAGGSIEKVTFTKLDYGDKGPHRIAWAKMERDYVVFNPQTTPNEVGFTQAGPDGITPMFIHRCQSKFSVNGALKFATTPQKGENMRAGLPGEEQAFAFLEELRSLLLIL